MSVEIIPVVKRQSPPIVHPDFRKLHLGPPQLQITPERRLVLLGKTGAGKSSSGNTILGEDKFDSERSFSAVTTHSEVQQAVVAGKLVSVVDTPGLFDTDLTWEQVLMELGRSIYDCSPGPHAFLIVVPLNVRFTQQEKLVTDIIRAFFGEDALKYTIILFTCGDQLEGKSVEKGIKCNLFLSELVRGCGGRYHVFNNKDKTNRRQVTELLEKIDKMVEENGGGYYSDEMLKDAERCRLEEAGKRAVKSQWEQNEKNDQEEQQKRDEIARAKREQEEIIKKEMAATYQSLMMESQQEIERLKSELMAVKSSNTAAEVMRRNPTVRQSSRQANSQSPPETGGFFGFIRRHLKKFVLAAVLVGGIIGGAVGGILGGAVGGVVGAVVGGLVGGAVGGIVGLGAVNTDTGGNTPNKVKME